MSYFSNLKPITKSLLVVDQLSCSAEEEVNHKIRPVNSFDLISDWRKSLI